MRTRAFQALLLSALLLLLGGCGDEKSEKDTSDRGDSRKGGAESKIETPAPLQEGGSFRVCTDVPYPPAEYIEDGEFVGYEIDIMNEVAERLGTTADYEKTLFDAIIPALTGNRCDAIISSMNVTPEREKTVAFVRYMEIGQSLMVPAGSEDAPESLEDLSGRTVGVQVGTTLKDALDEKSRELEKDDEEPIDVQTFPDAGSAAAALKADKVDVFFADSPVVADYVNKDEESFAFAGEPIDPLPVGIALRKQDKELQEAVQEAVDEMYEDGTMLDILERWAVEDFALEDASDEE